MARNAVVAMNFFGDSDFEDLEGDEPSYNRARGPTARTPGSGGQAEPDDDSHPSSVAPEALPLWNAGYREGASEVVETALQEGFDIGFESGIGDGMHVGRMLGAMSALLAFGPMAKVPTSGAAQGEETGTISAGQRALMSGLQDRLRSLASSAQGPDAEVDAQVRSHVTRVMGTQAAQAVLPPTQAPGAAPGSAHT